MIYYKHFLIDYVSPKVLFLFPTALMKFLSRSTMHNDHSESEKNVKKINFLFFLRNMYLHNDKKTHMKTYHLTYIYRDKILFLQYSLTVKGEAKAVIRKQIVENVVKCQVLFFLLGRSIT